MPNNNRLTLALLIGALLVCIAAALVAVAAWQMPRLVAGNQAQQPTPALPTASATPAATDTPTPLPPSSLPAVTPTPTATSATPAAKSGGETASPLQLSTEQVLLQAVIPERDQRLLAMRLKHNGQEIPQVTGRNKTYALGDTDTFWVTDNQQTPPRQFQVTATLKYVTPHSYWWVQQDFSVPVDSLARSAERFETGTYPTNRAFFGSEWSPGIDNDVRVHVFMGDVPGVAGYFSASNEYSRLAEPFSNEREMFFINLRAISPGTDYFDSVLAHEFQHMIHWYQDRNEDTWVNEGLSELATFINNYGASNFIGAFTAEPDTQLTAWADTPGESLANYGGSFLFMAYFLERFGEKMTQAVVANPNNGIAGFNAVLDEHGYTEQFADIFADFLVANYVNNPNIAGGRWGYSRLSAGPVAPAARHSVYPVQEQATVFQFGGDYIELGGRGDVDIRFSGATQVPVVDNTAHSGAYQWYSHRGDDSNSRLTRPFDLSNTTSATLTYWTWYDIEPDWDYGYVEVSTDGGRTWKILQPPHAATSNPSGNAYGPGYTGISGEDSPQWIEEQVDLSAYAGQEILLRFEYVTDDAVNRPGWTIDDIRIPEIGFFDNVENGPNGWQAEGFVRIDNILPQKFVVQVVEINGDNVNVRPIPLNRANQGSLTVNGLGDRLDRAVLVVSGLTPVTSQPAAYEYRITPLE